MSEYPWTNDREMKLSLEGAGWRYAILIGITGSKDQIEEHKEDRIKYAHLIKRCPKGRPIWDCQEAADFVHELTSYPPEVCAQWLDYDWN